MAGETILIVEDAPESLKYTAGVLRMEGYKVQIASTAEQALSTLRFLQPHLMLVDFILPGMNGLELTTRVKQDPRLQETIVVALTGCSLPGDEGRARQAGCDGYLTKPIDARSLTSRVRNYLEGGTTPAPQSGETGMIGLPDKELEELQESFLKAGRGLSRHFLASLDGQFDDVRALRTVHQWIGTAGLLGFPNVAHHAREVETALRTPPCTAYRLRAPLTQLARAFCSPAAATQEAVSPAAVRALEGKRVALIGLSGDEADRVCTALEQVNARARLFDADQSPYSEAVSICQLIVVHVRPSNLFCRWLTRESPGLPSLPTVFLGSPESLMALPASVRERASMFLTEDCPTEETLMRLRLAVTQGVSTALLEPAGPGEVMIADSDEASREAVKKALEAAGYRCRVANNGPDAILLLRGIQPQVAVVDVQMDGFEMLALIRSENMPVRTIFLTTVAQEDEILRAHSLGAEDYLAQPFSPLELVARLKRLVR